MPDRPPFRPPVRQPLPPRLDPSADRDQPWTDPPVHEAVDAAQLDSAPVLEAPGPDLAPDPVRYAGPDPRSLPPRHQDRPGGPRRPYPAAGRPPARGPWYPQREAGPPRPGVSLAEDEELVAGRRPVEEAFVARREAKRLLVVPQRRPALERLVLHATSLRIPVVEVEGGTLTAVAGFDGHQGIALVVAPRRWASPNDILALAMERAEPPLVLVLDSLEDPQNVGTLLRSAEASGVHGAIFPTFRQAPLTPAAVKASAGAVEHLQLAPVDDLPGALADLHARGLRIVGADGDAPLTAREADLRGPIAIVVGSEGRGLGPTVRRRCDLLVRIPMRGHVESLNAAVAGSILLYEAAAQRRLAETATDDPTGHADEASKPAVADPVATVPEAPVATAPEAPVDEVSGEVAPTKPRTARKPRTPRPEAPALEAAEAVVDDDLLPGAPAVADPGEHIDPGPEV